MFDGAVLFSGSKDTTIKVNDLIHDDGDDSQKNKYQHSMRFD
jgi:hypothetical protein